MLDGRYYPLSSTIGLGETTDFCFTANTLPQKVEYLCLYVPTGCRD
jgi:hypothetical protein